MTGGTGNILEFLHSQSYGKRVDAPGHATAPAGPMPGIDLTRPPIRMGRGLTSAIEPVGFPPGPGAAASGDWWPAAEALLYNALGIQRREPSRAFNDHRAVPSPRCVFSTHAYLIGDRLHPGTWHYDPVVHVLQPVEGAPVRISGDGFLVALACRYTQIPESYGNLRYALAVLEAGHCLGSLETVASGLGLDCRPDLSVPDRRLLEALGLRSGEGWIPVAVVGLGAGVTAWPEILARPVRAPDPVATFDEAAWLDLDEASAWRQVPPLQGSRPPPGAARVPDPGLPAASLADVLYARNAGRGPGGLAGRLDRLRAAVVHRAMRLGVPRPSATGIRFLVVVERVDGVADGLYEYFPQERAGVLLRPGGHLATVQAAFSYPPTSISVATCHMAWFLCADLHGVLARFGPRGIRLAHVEMGAIAQSLCFALAADGLFARPCRSFHEPILDRLLELTAGEVVCYEVLAGLNRYRDLLLDMRV